MKKINFIKMVASGNDFVVVKNLTGNLKLIAQKLCALKFGIGADGLLVLSNLKDRKLRMRIFNADGSEAEMCGNGARCAALASGFKKMEIFTLAGKLKSQVSGNAVKIQLTAPKELKLDIALKLNDRGLKVNFINTGVPHVVILVEGIDILDVSGIGRAIRYHQRFAPKGTNVNFISPEGKDLISIRTYERGVEGETLACGTGSTAAALIWAIKNNLHERVRVKTQSGEILEVTFKRQGNKFGNVWLKGSAQIVYKGEIYV